MIVLICGLPGVGKTSLARNLAPLINAAIISSDKIRKELIPRPSYTKQEVKLIYDVMTLLAKYLYEANVNCIIDATFNKERSRTELKKKLMIPEEEICIVECVCTEEMIMSRLKNRRDDYSDADISIYKRMKKTYDPILEDHIVVDTCQFSSEANAKEIVHQLKKKHRNKNAKC
ncbi:MAG: AAA family ATPase [Thermoproteota archaeon]|nr:AAA family ATPase [Thermoproteota archaeon]